MPATDESIQVDRCPKCGPIAGETQPPILSLHGGKNPRLVCPVCRFTRSTSGNRPGKPSILGTRIPEAQIKERRNLRLLKVHCGQFGRLIIDRILDRVLPKAELAAVSGVPRHRLNDYLKGTVYTSDQSIRAVARWAGIPEEDLIDALRIDRELDQPDPGEQCHS
jgi:transcriptional regulator with XRE-family HTH domain